MTIFILYAPNVHNGGGFVLLRALLLAWPEALPLTVFLDDRAHSLLPCPKKAKVYWVKASIGSRLKAESNLRKSASRGDTILCFHGLPPLLPSAARVLVFLQNRLYLETFALTHFRLKTRVRLILERVASRALRQNVSEYIVQTPAMKRALIKWYGLKDQEPSVRVLPFVDAAPVAAPCGEAQPEWDFVYVAYGEAHKNHKNLLAAWQLLAAEGLHPSLALTLSRHDESLWCELKASCMQHNLLIRNLGHLPHEAVMSLYANARAMIYPSTSESFGLPLIEATRAGLPILAPELDYVREVCVPTETFDPNSPVSIARAVKRFIGRPEPALIPGTPADFWRALL